MRSAAFSPIMMQGALMLPLTMYGIIDASATLKPATPLTLEKSIQIKLKSEFKNENIMINIAFEKIYIILP